MNLPRDPYVLLSCLNTRMRDSGNSLEELCAALDLDQAALQQTLEQAGFSYDPAQRRFS